MKLTNKGRFIGMLPGTLGASLLRNILAGKGVIGAGDGAIAKKKKASAKRQGQIDKVKEL